MFSNNNPNRRICVHTDSVNAYKEAEYWSDYADYIVDELNPEIFINKWKNAYIYSQFNQYSKYDSSLIIMNSKSGIKYELYVRNSDNPIEKGIATDTYPVDVWNTRFGVLEDSKINGINIASGEMVVEKDGDVYKIIFDFVDANGYRYEGIYEGELPYTNYGHL